MVFSQLEINLFPFPFWNLAAVGGCGKTGRSKKQKRRTSPQRSGPKGFLSFVTLGQRFGGKRAKGRMGVDVGFLNFLKLGKPKNNKERNRQFFLSTTINFNRFPKGKKPEKAPFLLTNIPRLLKKKGKNERNSFRRLLGKSRKFFFGPSFFGLFWYLRGGFFLGVFCPQLPPPPPTPRAPFRPQNGSQKGVVGPKGREIQMQRARWCQGSFFPAMGSKTD